MGDDDDFVKGGEHFEEEEDSDDVEREDREKTFLKNFEE